MADLKLLHAGTGAGKHIVFVHGLRRAGSPAWMSSGKEPELWPLWLLADISDATIWSLEHESAPSSWFGPAMARADRADNALARMLAEKRLGTGEVYFVTHSFGGLIVEQMIRSADGRAAHDLKAQRLLHRIRKVAFLGTPHRGSGLATLGNALRIIARLSPAAKGLQRNDPDLRNLNFWFRTYAPASGIATLSLMEGQKTGILRHIVKPDSADAGFSTAPIMVAADHFTIWSPANRDSEVYQLVRDFLETPSDARHPGAVLAETLAQNTERLDEALERTETGQKSLQRIEQTQGVLLARANAPTIVTTGVIDREIDAQLVRLRELRFFQAFDIVGETKRLAQSVQDGELKLGSARVRGRALAWCARMLYARDGYSEAAALQTAAALLADGEDIRICEAFGKAFSGDPDGALALLAPINTSAARTASFQIVSNKGGVKGALDWFRASGLSFDDLTSDGKFVFIQRQVDVGDWDGALASVESLQEDDFTNTPVLLLTAAGVHLAQAVAPELRLFVMQNIPFDPADFPLAGDTLGLRHRSAALMLNERASGVMSTFRLTEAAHDAGDRALWLRLRDPSAAESAKAALMESMRNPEQSLRRLPFALQFGLKVDLDAVEREIDRQTALSAGRSASAAGARLALALAKKGPGEVLQYIEQHRQQLAEGLSKNFLLSIEIQMLSASGQPQQALDRLKEAKSNLSPVERSRLERIIAESQGADPIETREAQFKSTGDLNDLAALVDALVNKSDWVRLAPYARTFFERTRALNEFRLYARCLYEIYDLDTLLALLKANDGLVRQSDFLLSILAWSQFQNGDMADAKSVLESLRSQRDDSHDRLLLVNIGIGSGDWPSLSVFVEEEWSSKRAIRSAADLLRAGQLAIQLGSARARSLIEAAASKADGDPHILIGCYSAAVTAGWENSQEVFVWLEQAAKLSGDSGPVRQMSLKDLSELRPDWDKREMHTWEQLSAGTIPIFAAAHNLSRTVVQFFLLPAMANRTQSDVRKRSVIFAYSGTRQLAAAIPKRLAFDPTALLTLELLGLFDEVFAYADTIVLPHGTLGWLFEEKQRLQVQQPSQINDATEIKSLIDDERLRPFQPTATRDLDLSAEVGDDLAAMLVEAAAEASDGSAQKVVVRPGPVHRVSSLMEEQADLSSYSLYLCSCTHLVEALHARSQLTAAEYERAKTYLAVRERPWIDSPTLSDGAMLYLDDVAVSYLQHLGLLTKISAAGFKATISPSLISQSNGYIRYSAFTQDVLDFIERLRTRLSEGLLRGKVRLARAAKPEEADGNRLRDHPTLDIFGAGALADAVVIDDRYFNQHGKVDGLFGSRPLLTSFDLLGAISAGRSQQREAQTALRRLGFVLVPVEENELSELLNAATIVDGQMQENAELRAVRESLQRVEMTDLLQLPKEHVWWDQMMRTLQATLKAIWQSDAPLAAKRARSDWVAFVLDARSWSHRFENADVANIRCRGWALMLSVLPKDFDKSVKREYWAWLDDRILRQFEEEDPDSFDWLAQYAKELFENMYQRLQNKASPDDAG